MSICHARFQPLIYWLRYWVVYSVVNIFFGCFLFFLIALPLSRFILDASFATDNINLVFFFHEWSRSYLALFVLCFATTIFFLTFSVLFSSHIKRQFSPDPIDIEQFWTLYRPYKYILHIYSCQLSSLLLYLRLFTIRMPPFLCLSAIIF